MLQETSALLSPARKAGRHPFTGGGIPPAPTKNLGIPSGYYVDKHGCVNFVTPAVRASSGEINYVYNGE